MKKYRWYFLIFLIIFLCFTLTYSFNNVYAVEIKYSFDKDYLFEKFSVGDNPSIIGFRTADVNGDEIKDEIIWLGNKLSSVFCAESMIIVLDGKTGKYIKCDYNDDGGYYGNLFVGDFTGDGVSDIMYSFVPGTASQLASNYIISCNNNQFKRIFPDKKSKDTLELEGNYIDNYKANIKIINTNDELTINLVDKKSVLIKYNLFDEKGKVLYEDKFKSYGYSSIIPVDTNYDGTYEMRQIMPISGFPIANIILEVQSLWVYTNLKWELDSIKIYKIEKFINHP